jgi:hypothetical protein
MWDKGCCIPHAITFAIHQDQEAMEGAKHDEELQQNMKNLGNAPSLEIKNTFKKF